jgi:predicted phage terminase large subunit-like protein
MTTPRLTKYIPTTPTVKQAAFLLLENRDAFFGGAAGGGKSEALLMAALQYVDMPNYNALIVRRTFRDLNQPQAIMSRAREWLLNTDARWNGNDKRWTFPSGATLTFGYLEKKWAHLQYQGAEFQFVGFDELTQFEDFQFLYLFSRLRRKAGVQVPLRIRSASNPGGPGHQWVKQRYIVEGASMGRIFIPSKLSDNPHVDQEEYLRSLEELDPITRAQLLAGDWDSQYDGGVFKREWWKYIDSVPSLQGARLQRHWDLAATAPSVDNPDPDYTAGLLMALMPDNRLLVLDVARDRLTPKGVEDLVKATAAQDGKKVRISIEQEPGASGKALVNYFVRKVLMGYSVRGVPPQGDKVTRATPLSSQVEAGNVFVLRAPWTSAFINEMVWFPQKGAHDDQVDGASGAFGELIGKPSNKPSRVGTRGLYKSRDRKKARRQ